MQMRARFICAGLAFAFLASACSEVPPTEPFATPEDDFVLFAGPQDPTTHITRNDILARATRDVPDFGGIYLEEGRPVVVMVQGDEPRTAADVRGALGHRLEEVGWDVLSQPMTIRPGQFGFTELNEIHKTLRPVLGLGGVVTLGIDPVANRVRVGVENDAAAAAVERAIEMAGVQQEAVIVHERDPIATMQTLRDFHRPVAGGLQINFSGFVCTLGFNVRSPEAPEVQGFVTNSHCTTQSGDGGAGMTQYGQPLLAQFIGNEVHDLPFFTGGPCPDGLLCRWSDSSGGVYAAGVDNVLGRIYRTTAIGSLDVDSDNPLATIVAERPFPQIGDVVHKTGRTTGHTSGTVVASCQDTLTVIPGLGVVAFLCQEHVATPPGSVAGGDSGSPVWHPFPDMANVRLNGILWGGTADGSLFVFSAMNEVRFENIPPPGFSWVTH